jgi:hypothetical protein
MSHAFQLLYSVRTAALALHVILLAVACLVRLLLFAVSAIQWTEMKRRLALLEHIIPGHLFQRPATKNRTWMSIVKAIHS